jgi:hypothetical protein
MKHTRESTAIIYFGQFRHHLTILIGAEACLHITSGKVINFCLPKSGDNVPKENIINNSGGLYVRLSNPQLLHYHGSHTTLKKRLLRSVLRGPIKCNFFEFMDAVYRDEIP